MRRYILHQLLFVFGILLLSACSQDDCSQADEKATLLLNIKSSGSMIRTRGVEDLNDDQTVSDLEKFVDGRKMYRLAVFLMDDDGKADSQVLEEFENENTEATVSFFNLDYSKTYTLYAVANYGNYGVNEEIKGHLSNVSADNIASGTVSASSSSNLCNSNTPYPLTLIQQIKLKPGINQINGELVRTYARIRINVRNQSSHNLTVTKLEFPSNITQSSANLFTESGTADKKPVVTSDDAITKFEQDTEIPGTNEKTIFDSYLLESNGGDYKYTLGLKYESKTENYVVSTSPVMYDSNIEDGAMYVMYNTTAEKYLYAGQNKVEAGDSYLTNGALNNNYVWKFTKKNGKNYMIESMGAAGYVMQGSGMTNERLPLTLEPTSSDSFSTSTGSNTIRFLGYSYLAVDGSSVYGNASTSNNNMQKCNFYLYKVEKKNNQSATNIYKTHEETIPITIINQNTGATSLLEAIRRNDFINILVTVNYNESTGSIEFKVSSWDEVEGDVDFS